MNPITVTLICFGLIALMVLNVYIAIRKGKQNAESFRHNHDLILPTAHAFDAAKKVNSYNEKYKIDTEIHVANILYVSLNGVITYRITAKNVSGYEISRAIWKYNSLRSIEPNKFELLIQYSRK